MLQGAGKSYMLKKLQEQGCSALADIVRVSSRSLCRTDDTRCLCMASDLHEANPP